MAASIHPTAAVAPDALQAAWTDDEIASTDASASPPPPADSAAAYGESTLGRSTIPLDGGSVTVRGGASPPGHSVWVAGRRVPVDAAGNLSAASAPVSATPHDTQAPSVPTGLALALNSAQHSITVSWNASSDNVGVVRYRVYRNGTMIGQPTGTSFTDLDLANKKTYSYTVEAVDAAGNVSAQAPAVSTYVS